MLTPLSMTGLALGMLLPPQYIVGLGLGGILRFISDKKYGKDFFKKKGMLMATGLMASSLIVEIFSMMFRIAV